MSKNYSDDLKLIVVEEYMDGKRGYRSLAKKYNISDKKLVRTWVQNYELNGKEGLKRKKGKTHYSLDFKLNVLHFRQSTGASYSETAKTFNLTNPSMIANWHRVYTEGGTEALTKPIGRPSKMVKKPSKKDIRQREETSDQTELERLHQEVMYLKIENAYLKKLKELGLSDHRDANKPNSH